MKTDISNILLLSWLTVLVGCGETKLVSDTAGSRKESHAAKHDHDEEDDHEIAEPATFTEAHASVASMKAAICEAFADGTPDDAHAALHEVGHLLEKLPGLAAEIADATPDQIAGVEAAVEKLFDGFGQLDGTMHGGAEVEITELDKQLTDALDDLKKAVE